MLITRYLFYNDMNSRNEPEIPLKGNPIFSIRSEEQAAIYTGNSTRDSYYGKIALTCYIKFTGTKTEQTGGEERDDYQAVS